MTVTLLDKYREISIKSTPRTLAERTLQGELRGRLSEVEGRLCYFSNHSLGRGSPRILIPHKTYSLTDGLITYFVRGFVLQGEVF
jgi:hypothetical protein